MAVLQVTRRPLAGGRGSAVVQIEEGAIRQMSLQEQVDAREFARQACAGDCLSGLQKNVVRRVTEYRYCIRKRNMMHPEFYLPYARQSCIMNRINDETVGAII